MDDFVFGFENGFGARAVPYGAFEANEVKAFASDFNLGLQNTSSTPTLDQPMRLSFSVSASPLKVFYLHN